MFKIQIKTCHTATNRNNAVKYIYTHSFCDIRKALQCQYNMQHVQGRQVECGTCWRSITETSCTAGQTKQAMKEGQEMEYLVYFLKGNQF